VSCGFLLAKCSCSWQLYEPQHISVGPEQGLGRALALYFSRHGSRIILSARNEAALKVRLRVSLLHRQAAFAGCFARPQRVQGLYAVYCFVARRCKRSVSATARVPHVLSQWTSALGPCRQLFKQLRPLQMAVSTS